MAANVAEVQEQRLKADILELQERLSTWQAFQNEYKTLEETLKFLPTKVSHEIMVPFGELAFMPGQLIHTNEILVLLGDNWFAERSASQAIEIVKRRQASIEENIQSINKEIEFLSSQFNFAKKMGDLDQDGDEIVQIKEEVKENDTVKEPGKRHRIARSKAKEFAPKGVKKIDPHSLRENMSQEDKHLFAKLDNLEAQERTNQELNDSKEELQSQDVRKRLAEKLKSISELKERGRDKTFVKRSEVKFVDEIETGSEQDSDDSSDGQDSHHCRTIRVDFTKTTSSVATTKMPSSEDAINTPTDIYCKIKQKPKSILKIPSFEIETEEPRKTTIQQTQNTKQQLPSTIQQLPSTTKQLPSIIQQIPSTTQPLSQQTKLETPPSQEEKDANVLKAFSGQVIDRTTEQVAVQKATSSEPKRISKFKAQRKK